MLRKVKEGFKRSWKGDKRLGKVCDDQVRPGKWSGEVQDSSEKVREGTRRSKMIKKGPRKFRKGKKKSGKVREGHRRLGNT